MYRNPKYLLLFVAWFISANAYTQTQPFEIAIEPISITDLEGVQSYAYGQDKGKWIIFGGRLDGLHQRQPFAAFKVAGHNTSLIVIDPITKKRWTAALTSLPAAIQEQLSSTNMQFYQEGDYLYCIGGYGYSSTKADHTTFANLTAIKVSDVINAVVNKTSFTNYFRQITDTKFQVTGGRLKKMYDTYYLLGGQKFLGRYNPMGPNHGPGFTQAYTNSIYKFKLVDNGNTIQITHLPSYTDSVNLHRRDYNAESQILSNGQEGITMFSGVFQQTVDLPFLNSVTIDSGSYAVNNTFEQHYNHYHCPVLPLYSAKTNEMHSVFFGGIAQFYDSLGILVQNDNVPFVNTIARVTRDVNSKLSEHKLPIVMPTLLGAGAEFIPNTKNAHYTNEVFKLDSLTDDTKMMGYIYGGISSTQANIFFINNGTQSSAGRQIFKVLLIKSKSTSIDKLNKTAASHLNLSIYPNPNEGLMNISFYLKKKENVTLSIYDSKGALIEQSILTEVRAGHNNLLKELKRIHVVGECIVEIETSSGRMSRKVMVK